MSRTRKVFGFAFSTIRIARLGMRAPYGVTVTGWVDDSEAGREKGRELRTDVSTQDARSLIQRLTAAVEAAERANGEELPAAQGEALPAVPLPEGVDDNARNVTFGFFQCRSCPERSETVLANEKGTVATDWDARHSAATGHKKFHLFTLTRQTAEVWMSVDVSRKVKGSR